MTAEREVHHDPQVLEGEDDVPRQPAPPTDPYTPEPGARAGERRAFRILPLAWLAIAATLLALVIWALVG